VVVGRRLRAARVCRTKLLVSDVAGGATAGLAACDPLLLLLLLLLLLEALCLQRGLLCLALPPQGAGQAPGRGRLHLSAPPHRNAAQQPGPSASAQRATQGGPASWRVLRRRLLSRLQGRRHVLRACWLLVWLLLLEVQCWRSRSTVAQGMQALQGVGLRRWALW
jgi:hypothetical protein